ncbi:hypothetical protein SlGVgp005 [Spodoptera litura granulovirus]|uniref:DUF2357 domain-containing protein n=1 Tax=Spodoptera litura granulovirus TaxID=359919 RepID=A5IZK7_9BBAC|nr:hypothetical protein SlGVgp005 [Spodoptera litura granulovirus]ABQ51948.1 hypothetical protein SlGVgp005 [Spodoptera litura granulovirus]
MTTTLSMYFDENNVYYNFDELLALMLKFNFERVDKKFLRPDSVRIKGANEQVYVTDGLDIDVRVLLSDECYVNFDSVFEIIDHNLIMHDKYNFEQTFIRLTGRVVQCPHPWQKKYFDLLQSRVTASFSVYFKVLEQYMLQQQPAADKIGDNVRRLVRIGQDLMSSNSPNDLVTAYSSFDKATALLLNQL